MHQVLTMPKHRPEPLELLHLSTPDSDSNGNPIDVWCAMMGGRGVKPPTCLHCAGDWCGYCHSDPLSASERDRLRSPEPVRYL